MILVVSACPGADGRDRAGLCAVITIVRSDAEAVSSIATSREVPRASRSRRALASTIPLSTDTPESVMNPTLPTRGAENAWAEMLAFQFVRPARNAADVSAIPVLSSTSASSVHRTRFVTMLARSWL